MAKLVWDQVGERYYETGVRNGVLYLQGTDGAYADGVAWNGLTAVNEKPTGAESSKFYANDSLYGIIRSAEEFEATIEAYTYPDEFAACDGSAELAKGVRVAQQARKAFGLTYRSGVGNDTEGIDFAYKIHLVYGGTASPSERDRPTVNDSPEAITFSWDVETVPVAVPGMKPTAHIEIDSRTADPAKLAELEDILYGTDDEEPRMPLPAELKTLFSAAG